MMTQVARRVPSVSACRVLRLRLQEQGLERKRNGQSGALVQESIRRNVVPSVWVDINILEAS